VNYEFGSSKFAASDVAARLKECKAAVDRAKGDELYKGAAMCARIRAGANVPFASVLAAMDACIEADLTDVDIGFGEVIPPLELRKAKRLPDPAEDAGD
jgi:hypothetical protein